MSDELGTGLVEAWNSQYPVGTPVIVVQDDGSHVKSETRSAAWTLEHGEAVVSYKGRSGGYLLSRVIPIASPAESCGLLDVRKGRHDG